MTVITALPTPPNRTQGEATFSANADAFMSALPTFVTQTNAVVSEINASQTATSSSASAAASSASAASSSANTAQSAANTALINANAVLWVSGTTYAQYAVVISPADKQSYRRTTTSGSGTTDPSADTANYIRITAVSLGAGGALVSGNTVLTASSSGVQAITTTSWGQSVQLPDSTTVTKGTHVYMISCLGNYDLAILDSTGAYLGYVSPQTSVDIGLADNTTASGTWVLVGQSVVGSDVLAEITFSDIIDTSISAGLRIVALDASRTLLLLTGNTNTFGVVYNSSTRTFGATVLIRAGNIAVDNLSAILVSTDKVLVLSCPSSSTDMKAVILTMSSSVITVNSSVTNTLASNYTASSLGALVSITGGFVTGFQRTGVVTACLAITVSGTVPTFGAENVQTSVAAGIRPILYQVSGAVCVAFSSNSTTLYARPMTLSGSTLTTGTESSTTITNNNYCYARPLASGRWGFVLTNSVLKGTVLNVSGTTATFSTQVQLSALTPDTNNITAQEIGSQVVVSVSDNNDVHINVLTDSAGTAVAGTPVIYASITGSQATLSPLGVYGSEARMTRQSGSSSLLYKVTISGNNPVVSLVANQMKTGSTPVIDSAPDQQTRFEKNILRANVLTTDKKYYYDSGSNGWAILAMASGMMAASQSGMSPSAVSYSTRGATSAEAWNIYSVNSTVGQIQKVRLT